MITLKKRLQSLILTLPICLTLALVTLPGRADAQESPDIIKASEPETISGALQNLGYRAVLKKDNDGDPMISSAAAGYKFDIFFYNCDDHTACRTVRLVARFHKEGGIKLEQANDWNKGHLFSKVYLNDKNDPRFVTDIRIGEGIPVSVFNTHVRIFDTDVAKFAK